ncbi:MAG: hypothetical protein ABEJ77_06695 [Halanaeroarchaeum sp.]
MARDSPGPRRDAKENALGARHGADPTLGSYLSSAFSLLSVPLALALAYLGHVRGLYPYAWIVPVFAGLFGGSVALAFVAMALRR